LMVDGDLKGELQPGMRLGSFPVGSTSLPTISGTPPPPAPTHAWVRIVDLQYGKAGNPGPVVIYCPFDPTASSWTVPQSTFDGFDPTATPSTPSDVVQMDLNFANVASTPA